MNTDLYCWNTTGKAADRKLQPRNLEKALALAEALDVGRLLRQDAANLEVLQGLAHFPKGIPILRPNMPTLALHLRRQEISPQDVAVGLLREFESRGVASRPIHIIPPITAAYMFFHRNTNNRGFRGTMCARGLSIEANEEGTTTVFRMWPALALPSKGTLALFSRHNVTIDMGPAKAAARELEDYVDDYLMELRSLEF